MNIQVFPYLDYIITYTLIFVNTFLQKKMRPWGFHGLGMEVKLNVYQTTTRRGNWRWEVSPLLYVYIISYKQGFVNTYLQNNWENFKKFFENSSLVCSFGFFSIKNRFGWLLIFENWYVLLRSTWLLPNGRNPERILI